MKNKRMLGASLMPRMAVVLMALLLSIAAFGQNFQLHYDFGRHLYSSEEADRQNLTLTYETFKADDLGSWFYFVDVDLRNDGASAAYTEVSREFRLGSQSPFAAHVEFDGGLNLYGSYQNALLIGPAYNGHSADFSKTWSLQLMYKQTLKGGFADLWTGYIPEWDAKGQKKGLVLLAEPQIWYNLCKAVSIGSEWEISNNFIYRTSNSKKSFYVNPTLALKFSL